MAARTEYSISLCLLCKTLSAGTVATLNAATYKSKSKCIYMQETKNNGLSAICNVEPL